MPEFNPVTITVAELARRLAVVPFVPFTIVMSNGERHAVPTADHLTITRLLKQVVLETDEPRILDINPVHIVALESFRPAA